jgi:hypothetical protein
MALSKFTATLSLIIMFTTGAHAADVSRPVLDARSPEPTQEVRGLKPQTHQSLWGTGENIAADARKNWGTSVGLPDNKALSGQETQCLVAQFTKAVTEGALAGANNLAPGVPADVLIRYVAFLDKQIEFFCKPPPGGGANLGQKIMDAWFAAATASARQKSFLQELRESLEKVGGEAKMTPREVTIAVGVAIILAAKELAPTPF